MDWRLDGSIMAIFTQERQQTLVADSNKLEASEEEAPMMLPQPDVDNLCGDSLV